MHHEGKWAAWCQVQLQAVCINNTWADMSYFSAGTSNTQRDCCLLGLPVVDMATTFRQTPHRPGSTDPHSQAALHCSQKLRAQCPQFETAAGQTHVPLLRLHCCQVLQLPVAHPRGQGVVLIALKLRRCVFLAPELACAMCNNSCCLSSLPKHKNASQDKLPESSRSASGFQHQHCMAVKGKALAAHTGRQVCSLRAALLCLQRNAAKGRSSAAC